MSNILEIMNLNKTYQEGDNSIQVLKGVNIALKRGEIVIIMGPSGSGKSTLLNILGGLEKPDSGEFYIEGKKVENFHKEPFASYFRRDHIGFVFQSFNLLPALNVIENISIPLILSGVSENEIKTQCKNILELVGLSHKENEYILIYLVDSSRELQLQGL